MLSLKTLKKIKIFEMLPDEVLLELAENLSEEKFRKGDFIIHRNEPGTCMYFLASGRVRIRVPEGTDMLLEEGNFFGEMALISGAPRGADVFADTDVRLLILSKQQYETELSSRPVFSRLLTQVFAERLGSPADELTDKRLGKYRIHRELGRGAMGVIYYGTHLSLEMPVAIKMLSHRFVFDTSSLRKFLNEAKIIASLSHKNIRSVIDIEQAYGTYFIIMEYIDGLPLDQVCTAGEVLPYSVLREIIFQIAAGLAHAYERGVVHRDIKPGNILINQQGEVKITDFGIAYANNENLKKVESLSLGTPYYAAPEQIRGELVDQQADIYSFGVMCYKLLTGRMPFEGSDPLSVFGKHLNEDYLPPAELVPGLPRDLAALVHRCLEKDKTRRLGRLSGLRELMHVWAFGEPYVDTMHQAIRALEVEETTLSAQQHLARILQRLQSRGQAAPVLSAAPVAGPGEGDTGTKEAAFAMGAGLDSVQEDLFEWDMQPQSDPARVESELTVVENPLTGKLIELEKKRQESILVQSLATRFLSCGDRQMFFKILSALFFQILKEPSFAILQSTPTGEYPAGSYFARGSKYNLTPEQEAGLISAARKQQGVLQQRKGASHFIIIPLGAGSSPWGMLVLEKTQFPEVYSGSDFFTQLHHLSCALPAEG